jgi:hypothetical protein
MIVRGQPSAETCVVNISDKSSATVPEKRRKPALVIGSIPEFLMLMVIIIISGGGKVNRRGTAKRCPDTGGQRFAGSETVIEGGDYAAWCEAVIDGVRHLQRGVN